MRRRFWRLFAVMATVTAMLVPAVTAFAGHEYIDSECDDEAYDPANPDHILYGASDTEYTQTILVDEDGDGLLDEPKMLVDLRGMTPVNRFVLFWDGEFKVTADGIAWGAVIYGSDFGDTICGTEGPDWIWGRQGADRIFGNESDEPTDSHHDRDSLLTNSQGFPVGGDQLFGNRGNDFIMGGGGLDPGDGSDEALLIGGGPGNDTIYANHADAGAALYRGGVGNDLIVGPDSCCPVNHRIQGGDGDDVIALNDLEESFAFGNAGNDTIFNGDGDDNDLSGNNGDDVLDADSMGSGDDARMFGGAGNDTLIAGSGSGTGLWGGTGNDVILNMGEGSDQVADGGPNADLITPADSASTFWAFGGGGNDSIFGGDSGDYLWGDYADNGELIASGIPLPRGYTHAPFISPGTSGDDYIEGGEGGDMLWGGPGSDTLYGNEPKVGAPNDGLDLADSADDVLSGGDGNDTLFANGSAPCAENDFGDGGANFAAGDSSWGLASGTHTVNVENHSDEAACPVLP